MKQLSAHVLVSINNNFELLNNYYVFAMERLNVCIIGSGNWATTIARNVGNNVAHSPLIEPKVNMYVYEEVIEGRKLTEIINTTHINVKYMPDFLLPENVVAYDDIVTTARDADIIIFAIPPTFVNSCCKTLLGKVKPTAHAVSVIKGFERSDDGQIQLISHLIMRQLKVRFETSISGMDFIHFLYAGALLGAGRLQSGERDSQ